MSTSKDWQDWPISPTFLSLRRGRSEETANYNRDGIYYLDYIRGFLADLSHDERVQNALTLFQFVPEDFIPNDPNAAYPNEISTDPYKGKGTLSLNLPIDEKIEPILNGRKIIRIESGTFINNGRRCDCFRRYKKENKDFCFKQDSIVGIFAEKKLGKLDPFSPEYRERLDVIVARLNEGRAEISKIKIASFKIVGEERIYIHYTCPKSFFEEHIFPIYVQRHIVACLVLGQMARESYDEIKTFYEDREEMLKADPSVFEYKIKQLNLEEWNIKARTIIDRIQTFEKRLEEKLEHQNTRYISEEFDIIEDSFRESVKKINIKKPNTFDKFTEALNRALAAIRKRFDNSSDGFIRMFALPVDIEQRELVPIGWTDSKPTEMQEFRFSLEVLKGVDALDKEEQVKRIKEAANKKIKEKYDGEHDVLLPGWLAGGDVAYIVWKRHSRELLNSISLISFDIYKKSLREFYSMVLESYSYIRATRMELLLETTIQESAHESAHFILPSIDVVEKHLRILPKRMVASNFEEDYSKYKDEYDRYRYEVLESLYQLNSINSGASLILSPVLKIRKEPTQVFNLLYKLKNVLDDRASDEHKSIHYEQKQDGVKASIDVTYFNHALYNLLDNAIKYGHEGSKIYIFMDVDRKEDKLNIRIVNYGIGIPKEDYERVYNLFERGTEASYITRGTGLGMYIVNKICKAHGGKVSHSSEKLSDYNIPILCNYENIIKKLTFEDIKKFEKELSWLSSIQYEVVSDRHFVEYANVFWNRLNMPTYKNTFYVTIPLY